jgi:hypothetical protein
MQDLANKIESGASLLAAMNIEHTKHYQQVHVKIVEV